MTALSVSPTPTSPTPTLTPQVRDAAADLEGRFGDPYDDANPVGFAAFGAADERAQLLPDGEDLLADWGFNAEFVPVELGGRLDTADRLARLARPVFRRDAALGFGYGVTSLMAAVNVWTAGCARQRARLAELLLAERPVAVAFHELDHGNDLLATGLRARPDGDRLVLTGSKQVINNAHRAAAVVLFARTSDDLGARSHSVLFVPAEDLPAEGVRQLPRYPTAGVRGARLGGIAFDGAAVSADAVVGQLGGGVETALRAFQVTRTVLPGMALGAVDASIRTVARFARARRLYGTSVADLPHARSVLVGAFTDLLVADCFATAAARGLHLLPGQASGYAAAVKFVVPLLAEEATASLATVLGARSYLREGVYRVVGKHLRDLPLLTIGYAGGTACLLTIMPQLPAIARRSWASAHDVGSARGEPGGEWGGLPCAPAPDALFDSAAPLPGLDFGRLRVAGTGQDGLGVRLLLAAADPELAEDAEPRRLVGTLADHLRRIGKESVDAGPAECGPAASPIAFRRAEECAVLWAAAACVGTWQVNRARGEEFLGGAAWLTAALTRLSNRLTGRHRPLPPSLDAAMFTEMLDRLDSGRSYCLDSAPVAG